ncbi:MAG: hypothetical protein MUF81_08580 [Verrucomicrobia bacterium]|jgi:hypothetical protein|nr:hypothetical protein [Verrucomicrobiota bacterium]
MKQIIAIACGGLLSISSALAGEPSQGDQKWLTAIEQKVAQGDTKISTSSEERVKLLKEWAGTKGYTVVVTKCDASYRVELSKSLAQK